MIYLQPEPLYPLFDPWVPALGRTHDFVLHKLRQQIPPLDAHSKSCIHFGEHDVCCDDNGHSPAIAKQLHLIKKLKNLFRNQNRWKKKKSLTQCIDRVC